MRFLRHLVAVRFSIASILASAATGATASSPEMDAALALFKAKRYPEARAALEQIIAVNPKHAAAHHYLGRTLIVRNDNAALEEGLVALARAVELEPENAVYLGVFGGASLQLAGRSNSLSAATKGRAAMEKALTIDPEYLAAREGLYQFYQRAPWPIGSSAKAAAQLAEIRRRDPDLATVLAVMTKANAKEFPTAFQMCEDVLARNPDNYIALYHYGRTASISGQNLERGLACLQRCLTVDPPTPASPSHSNVWQRIGNILQQLDRAADARAAYETALKLDPGNRQASDALAKLNE
jgi:tetratricopeptide (TPR) repeat protein